MSTDIARAGLDTFARLYATYPPPEGHEPKIQLYGGEPLLNAGVFKTAVCHFEALREQGAFDDRVGLATVTNGTLLTDDLADFIVAHGISVGVSIDGPPALNNLYRNNAAGIDAFTAAARAYDMLRRRDAKVGLSVTLTPEVVERFDEVLAFLCDGLHVDRGLGFNILHYTPALPVTPSYYDDAARCILSAFKEFRRRGVWEDRAMRKVVAFANRTPLHADCAAIGHQIVVAPDGSIGICQDYIRERTGFSGSVFDASYDPFLDETFLEWSRRSPLRMSSCHACAALAICGGGCPVSAEGARGSMWAVDDRVCAHSQQMLEFLIWDAFEQAEGRPLE